MIEMIIFLWFVLTLNVINISAFDFETCYRPQDKDELKNAVRNKAWNDVTYGPINNWCIDHITDFSRLFFDDWNFNEDISQWNVSQVTDMSHMFRSATAFNQRINSWNVSKVIDMTDMFWGASSFNQPLNKIMFRLLLAKK